ICCIAYRRSWHITVQSQFGVCPLLVKADAASRPHLLANRAPPAVRPDKRVRTRCPEIVAGRPAGSNPGWVLTWTKQRRTHSSGGSASHNPLSPQSAPFELLREQTVSRALSPISIRYHSAEQS